MGITHSGSDILMTEKLLNFPQILSDIVKKNRCHPAPAGRPEPKVERAVGERRARISGKHKLRSRKGDPTGKSNLARIEILLDVLSLEERLTQGARNRHVLENAPLPFNPQRYKIFSYRLSISPLKLNKLIKPARSLEERVREVKREGRAIALLPGS